MWCICCDRSRGDIWDHPTLAGHSLCCTITGLGFVYQEKRLFWPVQIFPLEIKLVFFIYYWIFSLWQVKFMNNINLRTRRRHRHKHTPALKCSLGLLSTHSFLGCHLSWKWLGWVSWALSQLLQDFPSVGSLLIFVSSLGNWFQPGCLHTDNCQSPGQLSLATLRLPFLVFSGQIHGKVFRDPHSSAPSHKALTPSSSAALTDRHLEWYPWPPKGEAEQLRERLLSLSRHTL